MTDTSSSPRWWDFDEFSSAKPSEAQRVTRDAQPAVPVASQTDPDLSDATPTDEFLASLPDDMAEAELEVAGYATTPPADDQAVPPPPAAAEGGDWVLPSMPGFAADLPTPPAPPASDAALIDLPDAADWAAEAEALDQAAASDDTGAGLADWDIPAVPGLHDEPAVAKEADDFSAAFAEADDALAEEDENVEYIPGTWSEDGGSWVQEGEEKRWTGADGAGEVVTTDMPEWMYEGPSTADEGWDEYEAYETAVAEYEAATGESVRGEDAEAGASADAEDYWAEQAAEPVAVPAVPAGGADAPAGEWDADQSWDAVADDDATSWDLPTNDDAAAWDAPVTDTAEDAAADDAAMSWDLPAERAADSAAEDVAQDWDLPAAEPAAVEAPAAWMVADEPADAAAGVEDTPISWEDINTWADESELAHQGEAADAADAGMEWGTTAQDPADWDTPSTDQDTAQDAASWAAAPADDVAEGWVTPSADAEAQSDGDGLAAWDLPDVTAEAEADTAVDEGLFAQPDAFEAIDTPAAAEVPAPPAGDTAGSDWQVTDTESSWASADQDATPAWGAPEEDTTTSWTTGEADVTPSWGADPAAESQWGEPAGEDASWDVPAPPAPGAMSFAPQSDDVLADPLSAEGDAAGFPSAGDQLPPPPPVGGSVPMAPEDLPEWMRPDEPAPAAADEVAAPLTPVSEEEVMAEEIAAPFNPVIAGVEDGPAAKVQDPGLITAPIPEDELPPPPTEAAPVRPTWGQPGPSGIGPAPITSPTLSHPVPEGGDQSFAVPPTSKAAKGSSLKRILIAVLAALLVMGGAYAAWEFYVRDTFFATTGGVTALKQGDSSVTFPAESDNQVEWTIDVPKNEAFALTMETPAGIQVGFVAQNAEGQPIGAANTLEDGKNGYRFVAQNDVDGPITLTAKASDSITADVNMRIVPFAGTTDTVDGVQWNVTVPADQSAIINVLTRGTNPNVVITTADGTEIGSSESFQSRNDENMYNAQFKVPAQAAEQAIVITLKTDQAYDATSTLIVDLHK